MTSVYRMADVMIRRSEDGSVAFNARRPHARSAASGTLGSVRPCGVAGNFVVFQPTAPTAC